MTFSWCIDSQLIHRLLSYLHSRCCRCCCLLVHFSPIGGWITGWQFPAPNPRAVPERYSDGSRCFTTYPVAIRSLISNLWGQGKCPRTMLTYPPTTKEERFADWFISRAKCWRCESFLFSRACLTSKCGFAEGEQSPTLSGWRGQ